MKINNMVQPDFGEMLLRRKQEQFTCSKLGDEMVMMNVATGKYLGMNSVGTDIWNLLENPCSVNQLMNALLNRYEVTEEQARAEIMKFLRHMQQEEMLDMQPLA